jgi:hypothetical protein
MEPWLLVDSIEKSRFMTLVRKEGSGEIQFETFSDLVVELDLSAKNVGGGPGLCEGETILGISIFGLDISIDVCCLRVALTGNLKRYTGDRLSIS